jgi:carotenoid cleavage dioxygenase-like enzyme
MNILFFILGIQSVISFIHFPFGPKFKISDREVCKKILYDAPQESLLHKINGFYGLIGPDINMKTVSNIYDLFTGDGVIQGIFFDKGELTFVRHFIRTDKLVYEEENGRVPNYNINKLIFSLFNKLSLLPNPLGLANTAILNVNKKNYALYERDVPYEINIDFMNKKIETSKRISLPDIPHFSAHSKYNTEKNVIETIDYDIMTNSVSYFELTPSFDIIQKKTFKMAHLPVIHDFLSTNTSIILFDSPISIEIGKIFTSPMPVFLDKTKNTIIQVCNKQTGQIEKYNINEGMYIFHYATHKENDTHIDIYAPMYDKLDFSELDISGKYRMVSINKLEKTATIIKTPELERLNVEFPMRYGNRILFRTLKNNVNNGFIIFENLTIIKHMIFEDRFICGEPAIQNINGCFYLIAYIFDIENTTNSFLVIINLDNYEKIEIPLGENISLGFHSAFVENK